MEMKDEKNYNTCKSDCEVTRQDFCHCVLLCPWGSYFKKTLKVQNLSFEEICAKIDMEANWIKPKHWIYYYGVNKPYLHEIVTKTRNVSFTEKNKECSCECYLCPLDLCKLC
jgi:hypothetical protein